MTDSRSDDIEDRAETPRPERDIASELRLRPEPPRVVRLSRKALALIAAVSAVALGSALIFALQSSQPREQQELYNTENRSTPEGLAQLPQDYSALPPGVPRLGPPLPGDLGRPMLNAGTPPSPVPGAAVPIPPGAPVPPTGAPQPPPNPEAQRRAQERQRIAQEVDAARSSRLFAAETRAQPSAPALPATLDAPGPSAAALGGAAPPPPAEGDRRLAFLNGPVDRRTLTTEALQAPESPYIIQAGAVIPAALITGLRSDLPGQITAQVTEHVYDSPRGRTLLIPQGSRLIGQYDAQTTFGQSRALLVWTRLILPDGRSIVLERQPGADAAGYAGLQDRVDNHWGQIFRAALISTVLSVGAETGAGNDEDELLRAIRRGSSDSISQTGRQLVGRSMNIQPTITTRPGFPVRVIVTRDLVLEPYRR